MGYGVGVVTAGYICASWAGWPLSFYLLPSTGFLWVILYYFFGAASPATHKTITEAERNYLQTSLMSQNIRVIVFYFYLKINVKIQYNIVKKNVL